MSSFEVEINTEYRTAVRFPAWMTLTVFSIVALVSLSARVKAEERGSEEKWALAVISISMCIGGLATMAYLFIRGIFVGQLPEAVMVRKTCIHASLRALFWGVVLSTTHDSILLLVSAFFLAFSFYLYTNRRPLSWRFGV